ncbi:arginine--tRNA ligase [archaeon]|nr:arginine--tRNA ligase [archaeon]
MNFEKNIKDVLKKQLNLKEVVLEIPSNIELGDYAFPCFTLSKFLKKSPVQISKELEQKIKLPKGVIKIISIGPYLNFFIDKTIFSKEVITNILRKKEKYGSSCFGKKEKVLVEFSSPNIAKPFGIGHLRSTVIGNSLAKIHSFLGYNVIKVNHIGDWGTQFGKLLYSFEKWGNKRDLRKDPINYLFNLYVKFHNELEKDNLLIEDARIYFKKLEEGNVKLTKLWSLFSSLSLSEFQRVYNLLNIDFDYIQGESFYQSKLDSTIDIIKKTIPTEISEGALIVNLKKKNMPPLLLRKTNGSTTYHTRDMAAALYRLNKFKPKKLLYVVGSEQRLHFNQLFEVLSMMNLSREKFNHVDFGLINFPEGKMSTRKGNIILLEEVLDKSINLALTTINKKNPSLKNKEIIAKKVGIGSIIFADLSNDRIRNISFDWDKILDFEGETAPYIQYTYARARSILKKSKIKILSKNKIDFSLITTKEEYNLIKQISIFEEVLMKIATDLKPHHLAKYLLVLSQSFNEFYHKHKVIDLDNKEIMLARASIVYSVAQIIKNGLNLLGIDVSEEM